MNTPMTPGAAAINRFRKKPPPTQMKGAIHQGGKPTGPIRQEKSTVEYDYAPSTIPPPRRQPTITKPRM